MNKEYLASLDAIREHLRKTGVISLKKFFDTLPQLSQTTMSYQPADYKYKKSVVKLTQLTIDFLENITDKKFKQVDAYSFSHTCFDLRKFFDEEGVFVIANISHDEIPEVGGEVFVIKNDNPLQIPSSTNTITLIKVDKEDESFVSYVNHLIGDEEFTYVMGLLT